MFRRTHLSFFFLIILMTSCTGQGEYSVSKIDKYLKEFESSSEQDLTELDLSLIYNTSWDKIYFFGGFTTSEEMEETIGFDCECQIVEDDLNRFVIVDKHQIIYSEDYDPGSVTFEFESRLIVDRNQPKLKVVVIKDNAGTPIIYRLENTNDSNEPFKR